MEHNYLNRLFTKSQLFLVIAFICSIDAVSQSDYSVTAIPHQVYVASLPVQGTFDDTYSASVPLTFSFDFYGNLYDHMYVGTNGVLKFSDTNISGGYCPWYINSLIPDANFTIKNAILGVYQDMDNSNAEGTITFSTVGVAPYRKFIVDFNNQSLFSCTALKASFQMVLYETLNIIDVQILERVICAQWNSGNAVTGIINESGLLAIPAPGRNTGQWTALQEGWRFARPASPTNFDYIVCDPNGDGFETFNLAIMQNEISAPNPSSIFFYETLNDAQTQSNPIGLTYSNIVSGQQTIYASGNGAIYTVVLSTVDCDSDYDLDTAQTADEDLNGDGNLANDDTDNDGIADFIDNDDDGDMILTVVEYVFIGKNNQSPAALQDTDSDGIADYLDIDDDGDGVWTIYEDYNGNNNPLDDDINGNSIPDYLDSSALHTLENGLRKMISIYPNPATDVLFVDNQSTGPVSEIAIYNTNGSMVRKVKGAGNVQPIAVGDLSAGVYFIKVVLNAQVLNYKFIKK